LKVYRLGEGSDSKYVLEGGPIVVCGNCGALTGLNPCPSCEANPYIYTCSKCGHTWRARPNRWTEDNEIPTRCPKCRTRTWANGG